MKVFKEEQRFTQTWLIIIISLCSIMPFLFGVYGIIQQIIYKKPFGDNPMSDIGLIFFTISMLLLTFLIFLFKLKTRIDEKGIYYQFFPIHFSFKLISWNEINKAYVKTYNPIKDYGGWGLKGGSFFSSEKGKAITISGDIGVQIELKNGIKILIGTQKETEVKQVLTNYQNKLS
ncbi:hypothetical protein [Tenacibaculum insulae]|uniref:hypothetical protein n=1 Tax=Tenacibaculum insulae TaxID=2029677 RepID=UPI003AB20D61